MAIGKTGPAIADSSGGMRNIRIRFDAPIPAPPLCIRPAAPAQSIARSRLGRDALEQRPALRPVRIRRGALGPGSRNAS